MPWQKILWIKQPFPDNYVDATFLSQLRRNWGVQRYGLRDVVADWSLPLLNIALTVIFVLTFMNISAGRWPPQAPLAVSAAALLPVVWRWAADGQTVGSAAGVAKGAVLVTLVVRALAPVFLSLTRSTSSDSIWSITAWLCTGNILFASRPWKPGSQVLVLSTNVALSATIVLASRLPTATAVFYFMMFSICVYVLLPTAARELKVLAPRMYTAIVVGAALVSDVLTWHAFGGLLLMLWLLAQALVLFALPQLFLLLQKYKDQIQGPWDPAKPLINAVAD